jgi:AAA15 family ATPase/GTPase
MLKRLHLQNFTVFADADFEFGPGLNVLVGTNGTGKSHILKLGYVLESVAASINKDMDAEEAKALLMNNVEGFVRKPADLYLGRFAWSAKLYTQLPEVFQSSRVGAFVRWHTNNQSEVTSYFSEQEAEKVHFRIYPKSENTEASISAIQAPMRLPSVSNPVFIPAKEILTLGWMLPASEQLSIQLEKNYLDLLNQLRLLPLRNAASFEAVTILSSVLGGEIHAEGDSYFLIDKTGRRISINMVAEGLRKFGTLQKLLSNGSLTKNTTLYWDEPEANLNPALLRKLAVILAELARQGFQIILATHSTDLLKEFHILSRRKNALPLPIKYFGLNAEPGEATRVVSTDNFEYLPDVVALAEELKQADELEEVFIRDDKEYYANNRGEE